MKTAFFFDMDGVLFDSMPNHATAWHEVMSRYGLPFSQDDCYRQEGRTGRDVIQRVARHCHKQVSEELISQIYNEKTATYRLMGGGKPMLGVADVLQFLDRHHKQIWVVTGGGQKDLFEQLEHFFPGIFRRERMITALDVVSGKPNPEPYLKAWERSGLSKDECCVVENAPLGVRAGIAAGLYTIAVNTGPLPDNALWKEGANQVFRNMNMLLRYLQDESSAST